MKNEFVLQLSPGPFNQLVISIFLNGRRLTATASELSPEWRSLLKNAQHYRDNEAILYDVLRKQKEPMTVIVPVKGVKTVLKWEPDMLYHPTIQLNAIEEGIQVALTMDKTKRFLNLTQQLIIDLENHRLVQVSNDHEWPFFNYLKQEYSKKNKEVTELLVPEGAFQHLSSPAILSPNQYQTYQNAEKSRTQTTGPVYKLLVQEDVLGDMQVTPVIALNGHHLPLPLSLYHAIKNQREKAYPEEQIKLLFLDNHWCLTTLQTEKQIDQINDVKTTFPDLKWSVDNLAFIVSKQQFDTHIATLHQRCQAKDIQIQYLEKSVEVIKWDIKLDFETDQNATIEVTYQGESVDEAEWQTALQTGIVSQNDTHIRLLDYETRQQLTLIESLKQHNPSIFAANTTDNNDIFAGILLQRLGVSATFEAGVDQIIKTLLEGKKLPVFQIPKSLNATLRPYQIKGFQWLCFLLKHQLGALLCDDMGLGKTVQTISVLAAIKEGQLKLASQKGPHLLVVPASLIYNWKIEIEKFCPSLTVKDLCSKEDTLDCDVAITTYDFLRRHIEQVKHQPFGVLILDEAHLVKNEKAKRSQALLALKKCSTICLTGTPLENHVSEFIHIAKLALPGIILNQEDHISDQISPFLLRRHKADVLKELPEKNEIIVELEMDPKQKQVYDYWLKMAQQTLLEATKKGNFHIQALTALLRLRQCCITPELIEDEYKHSSPKINYILNTLPSLLREKHSSLIFSQFTSTLDIIETYLKEAEIPFLRIDGKVNKKKRQDIVTQFQEQPEATVLLLSLKTGGVGLNLTRASYIFHMDPWWNPAVEDQATDRAHRIGQTQTVHVYKPMMKDSIEEKIEQLKQYKKELFNRFVQGSKEDKRTTLTKEDFEYLLADVN